MSEQIAGHCQFVQRYYAPSDAENSFYEGIGVKQFGQFIPTSGNRLSAVPSLFDRRSGRINDLRRFVRLTLGIEIGHTILAVAFLVLTGFIFLAGFAFAALASLIINILLNFYPIILQRHNRWRALRILRTRGNP